MNIILQHFTGELRELDKLSSESIKAYAEKIGAEYRLLRGQVFRKHLTPPCQKAFLLDESFDQYEGVLMLDIDVFAVKGLDEDVFSVPGVGVHTIPAQRRSKKRLIGLGRIKPSTPYWGGQFYKMPLEYRQAMRAQMPRNDGWMDLYNFPYKSEDEGILAELAYKAGIIEDEASYVDHKWCQCSFLPEPERAKMIHVRTKITPQGPKRTKMENYLGLVEKGVI